MSNLLDQRPEDHRFHRSDMVLLRILDHRTSSLAEWNAAAITELICGDNESGCSIESSAAELAETISQLRSAALEVRPDPQASE